MYPVDLWHLGIILQLDLDLVIPYLSIVYIFLISFSHIDRGDVAVVI
jgi:hypothetical protein